MVSFRSLTSFAIVLVSMTSAAPIAPVLVGNNVGLINVAAQNLNNNIGNQQAAANHSQGVQNNAQQNNSDQSAVEIIKDVNVLNNLTAVV
jgi:hypothetical protein